VPRSCDYVGRGTGHRWKAHAKPKPNDSNQRKSKYFGNYGPEAADREVAEIDQRGLQVDGTGTLLNDRRGSAIYGSRGKRAFTDLPVPTQRWMIRKRQPIPLTAILRRAGPALTGNPKRSGCPGAVYIDRFYPPPGEAVTIAKLLAKGRDAGYTDKQQLDHIAWDHSHGFVELTVSDGEPA
jgi:hypothetical protein